MLKRSAFFLLTLALTASPVLGIGPYMDAHGSRAGIGPYVDAHGSR